MTVTNKEWALLAVRSDIPGSSKLGNEIQPELYYLPTDPNQIKNLYEEKIEVVEELHSKMIQFLESVKTSEEIMNLWKTKRKS